MAGAKAATGGRSSGTNYGDFDVRNPQGGTPENWEGGSGARWGRKCGDARRKKRFLTRRTQRGPGPLFPSPGVGGPSGSTTRSRGYFAVPGRNGDVGGGDGMYGKEGGGPKDRCFSFDLGPRRGAGLFGGRKKPDRKGGGGGNTGGGSTIVSGIVGGGAKYVGPLFWTHVASFVHGHHGGPGGEYSPNIKPGGGGPPRGRRIGKAKTPIVDAEIWGPPPPGKNRFFQKSIVCEQPEGYSRPLFPIRGWRV